MAIFDDTPPANPVDDLVGEGKKYRTVEDLARAAVEKDRFIDQLKNENGEMRSDLNTRLSVEDQLRQFNESRQRTPAGESEPTPPAPAREEAPKPDLGKLIREEVTNMSREQQAQANLSAVSDRLVQLYGSEENAAKVTREKAVELGLGSDFLKEVAARSPKAFYAQLGITDNPRPSTPPAPRGTTNPEALSRTGGQAKEGTYAYYQEMRRTNPGLYHSPKVQQQKMQDAKRLGDDFYAS